MNGKRTGADSGSIEVYNYMLNRLKKELQEMTENKRFICCFSGGKDSTAMLIHIKRGKGDV